MAWGLSRNRVAQARPLDAEAAVTETDPLLRSNNNDAPTTTADRNDDDPPQSIGRRRGTVLALTMWVLIFLQASNMSGMTMAQSTIAADLNAYAHAMWFTSSYLITVASFAPLVGRLATIFPPGHLVLGSSLLFAAGALLTAAAQTLWAFLLGRVVSGFGGAGVMTLSLIAVLQLAGKRRRGMYVGLVNAGFTIGMSTGAIVYGALLPALGWRSIFLVQAPASLIAGIGVFLSMPHFDRDPDAKGHDLPVWQKVARIDYLGALLLTLTIVLLLYGFSGTIRPVFVAASFATLALFVATEKWFVPHVSRGEPIIPLELLRSRGVLLSCLAQMGVMSARWTVLYYAPIFMLAVRGTGAAAAGAVLIPTNLGFGTGGLIIGWLHIRRSGAFWLPSVLSVLLFGGSMSLVGLLTKTGGVDGSFSATAYVLALFANGFCTGAFLNYTLAHLLHLTRPSTHFVATSLLATFRGFSGSFGTSIGGGFFMRRLNMRLVEGFSALDDGKLSEAHRELIPRLVGSPALVYGHDTATGSPALTPAERAVAVAGYVRSMHTLFQVAAVVGLLVMFLQAGTGWTEPKSWPHEHHHHSHEQHAAAASTTIAVATGAATLPESESSSEDEVVDEEEILEAIAEHDGTMEA